MLERLEVRNLGLIETLDLDAAPGLNLLTGETGSGKSMLLDALGFVVGARASADLIRSQSDSLQVGAVFAPPADWTRRWKPWFEDKGLPFEDGTLHLKRELRRDGKGRAWINASAAPVGLLAELGQGLVDFHGQHDHQALLRVPEHRGMLDHFAGSAAALDKVAGAFADFQSARRALDGPEGGPDARRGRLDLLAFQEQELAELGPKAGEWEGLRQTCDLQAGAGRRAEALGVACAALDQEEQGTITGLLRALAALKRLPENDPARVDFAGRLEQSLLELRDVNEGLGSALASVEMDPVALERLQARLHTWEALARKHRCTPEELPALWGRLSKESAALRDLESGQDGLKKELEARRLAYVQAAVELGQVREKAAARLVKALGAELRELIGPGALFTVRLARREDPAGPFLVEGSACAGDSHGVDEVEFLFAANPGEQPKPLARVASGGELSRVALGLKTVLARREGAPSLVFDEIDAGVSGRVAALVGERIAALAASHQVFCITHLPQIASLPGKHFRVSKAQRQGRTLTEVESLDRDGRERELAALLGSTSAGQSALVHARQLLDGAESAPLAR